MNNGNNNFNNQVPRAVRGTGFFTPMDLAPGEAPDGANTHPAAQPSENVSVNPPATIDMSPAGSSSPQLPTQAPQPGDDNNAQGG